MFLRCPFNLQRIFQDGIHRSKIEFMVGPGSDVNLTSEPPMVRKFAIHEHASHSQFSHHPGSGVNLTSESDNTLVIALSNKRPSCSEAFNLRRAHNCLQSAS